jgi:alanine dehydrogenase
MKVGIPREIKQGETRVAARPSTCERLIQLGAEVWVETDAGNRCGFTNQDYESVGAKVVDSAEMIYGECDLVVKVKEPLEAEYPLLRKDLTLFCYLHLAAVPGLAKRLQEAGTTAVCYETIVAPDGSLPLLKPMSQVAGRLSVQIGAYYLQSPNGGSGVLLGGVPGTASGHVVVVGTGSAGTQACEMAIGLGARVTVLDVNQAKLERVDELYHGRVTTLVATNSNMQTYAADADLLVGAVLIPGGLAPTVVHKKTIQLMRPGSVVVDIAIDQGGCIETIRPTSHQDPIYQEYDVIHYAVPNMPALVGRTSTIALTQATEPYLCKLVELGIEKAFEEDSSLKGGINVRNGEIVHTEVRKALQKKA